jgi:hypothetical protein
MDIPPVYQHGDSPPSGFTVSKKNEAYIFPKTRKHHLFLSILTNAGLGFVLKNGAPFFPMVCH